MSRVKFPPQLPPIIQQSSQQKIAELEEQNCRLKEENKRFYDELVKSQSNLSNAYRDVEELQKKLNLSQEKCKNLEKQLSENRNLDKCVKNAIEMSKREKTVSDGMIAEKDKRIQELESYLNKTNLSNLIPSPKDKKNLTGLIQSIVFENYTEKVKRIESLSVDLECKDGKIIGLCQKLEESKSIIKLLEEELKEKESDLRAIVQFVLENRDLHRDFRILKPIHYELNEEEELQCKN